MCGYTVLVFFREVTPIFHLGTHTETQAESERVYFATFPPCLLTSAEKTPFSCLTVYLACQHTAGSESQQNEDDPGEQREEPGNCYSQR